MSSSPQGRKRLPSKPSEENLRKQAKRRAKRDGSKLSDAQHQVARDYGFMNWPKLIEHLRSTNGKSNLPEDQAFDTIIKAAKEADVDSIAQSLAQGISPDSRDDRANPLLVLVAKSKAPNEKRLAATKALIDANAHVRAFGNDGTEALHWAAWFGPISLVEMLIRAGGLVWKTDDEGHDVLHYGRHGVAPDKELIVELLDRPVMRDPAFNAAAHAIQAGDISTLKTLLARHPDLIHAHAIEPDCYPKDYFRDPALVWFIANNPNFVSAMPANMVEVARTLIDAGAELKDLQYTLGLVMTSSPARKHGLQRPLIQLLLQHGARVADPWFTGELGHRERDAVCAVLESGVALTAPAAAGLGRVNELAQLLKKASADEKHAALCLAVINQELEAARVCLEAGAEVNRSSVCHRHSMPIHQAAVNDDVPMLKLLIEHGARLDVQDTLWNGTPLGWAIHTHQRRAEAYLRSIGHPPSSAT